MSNECVSKRIYMFEYADFNKTVALNLGEALKKEPILKDVKDGLEYKLATLACQEILKKIYEDKKSSQNYGLTLEVKDNAKKTIDCCLSNSFEKSGLTADTINTIKCLFESFLSEKYESIRNLSEDNAHSFRRMENVYWPFGNYIMKLSHKGFNAGENWYLSILNPANSI